MTRQEEVAQFSEQLIDLLYDFEEFIEVDNFDLKRFTELQALSRKAAPRIVHIVTRMKLEPVRPEPVSPDGGVEPLVIVRQSPADVTPQVRLPYPDDLITAPNTPEHLMGLKSVHALHRQPSDLSSGNEWTASRLPPVQEEIALALPAPALSPDHLAALDSRSGHSSGEDAWSWNFRPPGKGPQRREFISLSGSGVGSETTPSSYRSTDSPSPTFSTPVLSPPPRSPARLSPGISATQTPSAPLAPLDNNVRGGSSTGRPSLNPRDSVTSSGNVSTHSPAPNQARERDSYFEVSPLSGGTGDSIMFSTAEQESQSPIVKVLQNVAQDINRTPPSTVGLEVDRRHQDIPDGLMPVVEEESSQPTSPNTPLSQGASCDIILSSSFYQFRGFCPGAIDVIQGGIGVRRIKKQVSLRNHTLF